MYGRFDGPVVMNALTGFEPDTMASELSPLKLSVFGCDPATTNRGVSALYSATLSGLSTRLPFTRFTVFDSGMGQRHRKHELPCGTLIDIRLRGLRGGKRFDRSENVHMMKIASRLGALGALLNSGIREIDSSAAALDISGGDSFSDIYGTQRFFSILKPKLIAIQRRIPLFLMPQTYGPFACPKNRKLARHAVLGAEMAWARDKRSFEVLADLLGSRFNPMNHRCGVDVAFGLPIRKPSQLPEQLLEWLDDSTPNFGLNVSGLIYNDVTAAKTQYNFRANYRETIEQVVQRVLAETEGRVFLVPHVMARHGSHESDPQACEEIYQKYRAKYSDRIMVTPSSLDECEVKWLIAQMDWFCGTRMHSTIAALSSLVPTCTIAYSDKARGVFEMCGAGEQVFDPRQSSTAELVECTLQSLVNRFETKRLISQCVPSVKEAAEQQLQAIADRLLSCSLEKH